MFVNNIRHALRFIHTIPKKQHSSHWKKSLFVSILTGSLLYDGFVNDLQYYCATERFLRSSKIAIQIAFDYAWNLRRLEEDSLKYKEIVKVINQRSADLLLQGCMKNGGLYIKLGQNVSALNHILPIEYTETLKQLQDKCLKRKPDEVNKLFLEDFGKKPDELFNNFDYNPIAAASLAQVFKAETKDGETIAVKVQYIDLQKRFRSDVGTIWFLTRAAETFFKNYKFSWIIEDLHGNMLQELDFIHEGQNAERCAADLKKFDYIYIPKVLWNFTGMRVLTTEFIDGIKISDIEELKKNKLNIKEIDTKLFTVFSEQIFNSGFVHADPHPGNVFVRRSKNGKVELVLLDHGLYENISQNIRQSLCHFWKGIVLMDHEIMKKYSNALNVSDHEKFAEILLQRPLEPRGAKYSTKITDEDLEYLSKMARERFDIVIDTLKSMPRNLIFVVRNLNTIRAIAHDHGDPIDRLKIMARYALSCIKENRQGYFSTFKWFKERCWFEYKLWSATTKYWFLTSYLNVLRKLGRSPDTTHLFNIGYNNNL